VLRKYDIQIVQEAIKYLCKDEDMSETIEDIQNEVERRIGRTFRSSMLPLFKSFPDNFDTEEVWWPSWQRLLGFLNKFLSSSMSSSPK
jgi:hypothetical protein